MGETTGETTLGPGWETGDWTGLRRVHGTGT
jgi:hypothetical protein